MIIASHKPAKIGAIMKFYQKENDPNSPSAIGLIIREATLKEFLDQPHPTCTVEDLIYYEKHPCKYHYEVSTD